MKSSALSEASLVCRGRKATKSPWFSRPTVIERSEQSVNGYNISVSRSGSLAVGRGDRISSLPFNIDRAQAYQVRIGNKEALDGLVKLLVKFGYMEV